MNFVMDTACGGFIIHSKFVKQLKLTDELKTTRSRLEFADGSLSDCVKATKIALSITDSFGDKIQQRVKVVFSNIGDYDAIIGLPWMKKYVEYLIFANNAMKFLNKNNSTYPSFKTLVCDDSFMARQPSIDAARAPTRDQSDGIVTPTKSRSNQPSMDKSEIEASDDVVVPPLSPFRPSSASQRASTRQKSQASTERRVTPGAPPCSPTSLRNVSIDVLSTKVVRWNVRRQQRLDRKSPDLPKGISLMTIKQVTKALRNKRTTTFLAKSIFRINGEDAQWGKDTINFEDTHQNENPIEDLLNHGEKSLDERLLAKFTDLETKYAKEYTRILAKHPALIPSELPNVSQLQEKIKHDIKLSVDAKPKASGIYHCSKDELAEMKRQITELLKAGHIRHSMSPWAAPVLFVKKKGTDTLRMCIDFRHLNRHTIKDATPIARIDELRQRLVGAKRFTAVDMMSGYNQIKIEDSAIPYTAFNCRYGHFEWLVMPFGLTNAPATFSRWINLVLGPLLDKCVVAYLDDILIYSKSDEQHILDVEAVMDSLAEAGAILNLEKSHFHKGKVEFLGHNVDGEGITPNTSYIEAISKWPKIENKADVGTFCGMINYFKAWIPDYAELIQPLNNLRKKDAPFIWDDACDESVRRLQEALTNAPVLVYFDETMQTVLTTDASAYAIGGFLGQRRADEPDTEIKPILYWSRKMKDAETRYGTHERELLAVVEMLRVTRPYVEGRSFIVKTDHEALKWLNEQANLSRRQANWVEKIQSFDMTIEYLPGKFNSVADALSRRPDYYPNCPRCSAKITSNATKINPHPTRVDRQRVDRPYVDGTRINYVDNVNIALNSTVLRVDTPITEQIKAAYSLEEKNHVDSLITKPTNNKAPNWRWIDGTAYYGKRVFVPTSIREKVMYTIHDVQTIHSGNRKTIDLLQRQYYWPNMGKDVRKWIGTCDECQRKLKNRRKGMLRPLDIPQHRFTSLAMDHADAPSTEDGFDKILVVIDRLRKYLTLIPAKASDTAEDTARRFFDYIVRTQGIPQDIVVDRDSLWTSKFWTALSAHMNVQMNITTARHQNANGLAESSVKSMKKMLTSMLNRSSTNSWIETLPIIQLAYNNMPHTSTGFSPNEMTFGTNLNTAIDKTPTAIKTADEISASVDAIIKEAQANILKAQEDQAKFYNISRRRVTFKKGDQVLLATEGLNIQTSPKYTHRFIGPFEVLDVKENENYKLDLPAHMRVFPIFHISKLHLYRAPKPESLQATLQRPKPVDVDGEEGQEPKYYIDRILKHRFVRAQGTQVKEYYCKWTGYDVTESTWEPYITVFQDVPEMVEEYEKKQLNTAPSTQRTRTRKKKRT